MGRFQSQTSWGAFEVIQFCFFETDHESTAEHMFRSAGEDPKSNERYLNLLDQGNTVVPIKFDQSDLYFRMRTLDYPGWTLAFLTTHTSHGPLQDEVVDRFRDIFWNLCQHESARFGGLDNSVDVLVPALSHYYLQKDGFRFYDSTFLPDGITDYLEREVVTNNGLEIVDLQNGWGIQNAEVPRTKDLREISKKLHLQDLILEHMGLQIIPPWQNRVPGVMSLRPFDGDERVVVGLGFVPVDLMDYLGSLTRSEDVRYLRYEGGKGESTCFVGAIFRPERIAGQDVLTINLDAASQIKQTSPIPGAFPQFCLILRQPEDVHEATLSYSTPTDRNVEEPVSEGPRLLGSHLLWDVLGVNPADRMAKCPHQDIWKAREEFVSWLRDHDIHADLQLVLNQIPVVENEQ